jgi:hypothetical protein
MLIDLLIRASRVAPDTTLARLLRRLDRLLLRMAELDARAERSSPPAR